MGKSYQIGNGKSKEESEIKQKLKDSVGKVASFSISDTGDYRVLIEEVNGSKIKGLVIGFDSCYPSVTFPDSSVPAVIALNPVSIISVDV